MAKIGLIHYNQPGYSFDEFLALAADAGAGFVELHIGDVWDLASSVEPEQSALDVKQKLQAHGLRLSALSADNDFVQSDPEVIKFQVERMKRVCQIARLLDDEAVVRTEGGHLKDEVPAENHEDAMYECFSRCVPFIDELKVPLAIDNHGLVTNNGDLLISLLNRIDHPLLGSNLDTMNFRWFGNSIEDCDRFYQALAPRVLHVHLKDGFDGRDNYRGATLGEGEIHLDVALEALLKVGYNGVYTAEYEGPELEGAVGYRKCIKWMAANL